MTFDIPIVEDHGKRLDSPDTLPDRWVSVPAHPAGVPGLIITAYHSRTEGVVAGRWVITQKPSGRTVGPRHFTSIAAARRAAIAIADEVDWTNTAAVWGAFQDEAMKSRVTAAMSAEGEL